jgi:predicted transcriptional regulator
MTSILNRKEMVLEIVKKNPGIRFNEIMRISDIRNGTLSHYVKKLENAGSIMLDRTPRVTRLYPTGIPKNEAKICKFLTIETQRKILLFLMKKEVATSAEIKKFVNKSPSVISVNLNQLFREKIINKEYDIPSNKYSIKNPELINGIINEYYPNLFKKLTDNTIELLDLSSPKFK